MHYGGAKLFLKSIEIQGFKSFPDKTLLNFGRGITAIVGPNGSGKSNIVDAIRWVLGEQSAKTLRGGRMEDVIFGGTLKRNAQGFCQVSLIVDNADRGLPIEFDEIEVTRRYYRSGESEFYINRKAVRLKDIHELFMDTGLGRDGYSVIGQGRIDEILSVKSVDRREIFEEASGISKFRYRKEESERKLAACEDNLNRVRDIITELEGQVEPLRIQSEKASAWLVYRDELRVLEVSVWLDSLDKLKDTLQKAKTDFENAERMLSAKKDEVDRLYARSDALSEETASHQRKEDELREELRVIEDQRGVLDTALASSKMALEANEKNISDRTSELYNHEDRVREIEKNKADSLDAIKAIDDAIIMLGLELAEIQKQADEIRKQGENVSAQVDALQAQLQIEQGKRADAEREAGSLAALEQEIIGSQDSSAAELTSISERLAAEEERAEAIDSEIEENEDKKTSALNMLKGFELRLNAREKKVQDMADKLAVAERTKNAKIDRQRILQSLEREYEGFSNAVKRVMQASERGELRGIHGPVSSLIETEDKYAVAIEIAMGSGLQNVVVDSEEDGKRGIEFLKRTNSGRATFRPLTAIKDFGGKRRELKGERGFFGYGDDLVKTGAKYKNLISSMLCSTAVCQDMDCAIAMAKKHGYSFRIVTLDGQLINPNGSMTGGSIGKSTGILSRANELARLATEIEQAETDIKNMNTSLAEAKRELEASRYESGVATHELESAEKELIRLNAEKTTHDALLETLRARKLEIEKARSSVTKRLAVIAKQKAEYLAQAETFGAEADKLTAQRDELLKKLSESEKQSGGLSERAFDVREEIAAKGAEKEATNASVRSLDSLLEQLRGDKRSQEQKIDDIKKENAALSAEIASLQDAISKQEKQAKDKNDAIRRCIDERLRVEGAREKCNKEAREGEDTLRNLSSERDRLEHKKIQAEKEEDIILDKMWENYELTRVTAAEVRVELESLSSANRRIGELRSSMKKLGSVNIDSIEEYKKVSERYNFLTEQRDDLEKAKVDLLKVIDDLTRNMKTIFAEQFKLINEQFGRTFVEIFGGGSAKLILEDESDILNCGIEIRVEMPGKSARAISLLSGGEKAFVAIALYFAVIKVRPTPFCVLDEIEAALDDINVVRYVDYMRTLCDKTQFIVITHRRGTMEGSDILYGVTMPEQGVTKLLAININDVEEKINIKPN
ncbi:MAG: chromosome segregation protein SMC [Clostridia bacterium]|nr:chromosome segregation protein SMC [Clostridia bacterium]